MTEWWKNKSYKRLVEDEQEGVNNSPVDIDQKNGDGRRRTEKRQRRSVSKLATAVPIYFRP